MGDARLKERPPFRNEPLARRWGSFGPFFRRWPHTFAQSLPSGSSLWIRFGLSFVIAANRLARGLSLFMLDPVKAPRTPRSAPPSPASRDETTLVEAQQNGNAPGFDTHQIPGYTLFDVVGVGGCGTVYRAQSKSTGKMAAVKILRKDLVATPRILARFEREMRVLQAVEHPNVVRLFELGQSSTGQPFYAMEFIRGTTLKNLVRQNPALDRSDAVSIFREVLKAVTAVHNAKIIHRDLKSSNILVHQSRTGAHTVKLLDFGVAKLVELQDEENGLTKAGTMVGSVSVMSPEQIRGEATDYRADIYALGVLLYELLTQSTPFIASSQAEVLRMHLNQAPPRPSLINPLASMYDSVIVRAMQKKSDDRYQSVAELADDLAQVESGRSRKIRAATPLCAFAVALGVRIDPTHRGPGRSQTRRTLLEIQNCLDEASQAGPFLPLFRTLNSYVSAQRLGGAATEIELQLQESLHFAQSLQTKLETIVQGHEELRIALALHIESVPLRSDGQPAECSELLEFERWCPASASSQVALHFSDAFLAQSCPNQSKAA